MNLRVASHIMMIETAMLTRKVLYSNSHIYENRNQSLKNKQCVLKWKLDNAYVRDNTTLDKHFKSFYSNVK